MKFLSPRRFSGLFPLRVLVLGVCIATLAGCGGGGDSATAAPAGNAGSVTPGTTPIPPVAAAKCGEPAFVGSALAAINAYRAAGATCGGTAYPAAAAVKWNAELNQAARSHSDDMSAQNYFSHTSLDGRSPWQRMSAAGYTGSGVGENIAAGYPSVSAVIDGWMKSAGHCANIMNATANEIGLACAPGTSTSAYSNYWTMTLGKAR